MFRFIQNSQNNLNPTGQRIKKLVYSHNGILYGKKKEQTTTKCSNLDDSQK